MGQRVCTSCCVKHVCGGKCPMRSHPKFACACSVGHMSNRVGVSYGTLARLRICVAPHYNNSIIIRCKDSRQSKRPLIASADFPTSAGALETCLGERPPRCVLSAWCAERERA